MADDKIEHEREVSGFNPWRHDEKPKPQVGPAPTGDPHGKASPDLKMKIDEKRPRKPPN